MERRICSFIMAMLMVFTMLPTVAWAEIESADELVPEGQEEIVQLPEVTQLVPVAEEVTAQEKDTTAQGEIASQSIVITPTGTCGAQGDNLTWELSEDGVLTISGSGAMEDYHYPHDIPWASYRDEIVSVLLPQGLTSICDSAFNSCTKLTSIDIPNTVLEIGDAAFLMSGLTSVVIPEGVQEIGIQAFQCADLTSINIPASVEIFTPRFSSEKLETISVAENSPILSAVDNVLFDKNKETLFCYPACKTGNSYTIPDSVIEVALDAFSYCKFLEKIAIPKQTRDIPFAYDFSSCSALKEIEIASENVSYCSENGVVFNKDKTELLLYLPNNEASSYTIPNTVTTVHSYSFTNCNNLTNVVIPASVTSMSHIFDDCTALNTVRFEGAPPTSYNIFCSTATDITVHYPDSTAWSETVRNNMVDGAIGTITWVPYTVEQTTIAFGTCGTNATWSLDNYGTLTISGTGAMADYQHTGEAWWDYKCSQPWCDYNNQIGAIVVEHGITAIGDYAFYACMNVTSVSLPDTITAIGNRAFALCRMESIVIPDGVTVIEESAFSNCDLTQVQLPASLIKIEKQAFAWNQKLTEIEFPNTMREIGQNAFFMCYGLTQVTLNDGLITVGSGAFCSCDKLTQVTIPASVMTIGEGAFTRGTPAYFTVSAENKYFCAEDGVLYNKNKSILIHYPEKNSQSNFSVPSSVTEIAYEAFYACSDLQNIQIPDSVEKIGKGAFSWCYNLTDITLPTNLSSIGSNVFNGCSSLSEIALPNGITSIGGWAFESCRSLSSITIPASVALISDYAFSECENLKNIRFKGEAPQIDKNAFCRVKTANAYYPAQYSASWENAKQNYGGTLTWSSSCTTHVEVVDPAVDPTCVATGKSEGKHCFICDEILVAQTETPHTGGHDFSGGATCSKCNVKKMAVDTSTPAAPVVSATDQTQVVVSVADMESTDAPVTVKLADGFTLKFDTQMIDGLANEDLTIVAEKMPVIELPVAQQKALEKLNISAIMEISIYVGTEELHEFDGSITVSANCAKPASGKKLVAYLIGEDGKQSSAIPVSLNGNIATFVLKHLSTYVLAEVNIPAGGGGGSYIPSGHQVTSTLGGVDKVYVDGVLVDASNYTVSGGNIVLSQKFLDGLKAGEHTVKLVYGDRQATGTFTTEGNGTIQSAKTFDAGIAMYVGMVLCSAVGAAYVVRRKKA